MQMRSVFFNKFVISLKYKLYLAAEKKFYKFQTHINSIILIGVSCIMYAC